MSLQFIIDGYNIINHPIFTQRTNKKIKDKRVTLLQFIKIKRLAGSPKNKITVVFDGHPNFSSREEIDTDIDIVFSRNQTADERIKKMVEASSNLKSLIVVSDDKEIKFFIKSIGARAMSVEEFIGNKKTLKPKDEQEDSLKLELTYSQMHKINQELKKIWLSNP